MVCVQQRERKVFVCSSLLHVQLNASSCLSQWKDNSGSGPWGLIEEKFIFQLSFPNPIECMKDFFIELICLSLY